MARISLKTAFAFIIFNFAYAILNPLPILGRISAYNVIYPGRKRLPYGSDPQRSYNLTLNQLDAMFSSHEINGTKLNENEFRVIILGDSSVWGFLLGPDQTVSEKTNLNDCRTEDGKRVRAYNLGYPTMSVTKDLLLLEYGVRYKPDMILWLVTLESLPIRKQIDSPIVHRNPTLTRDLIQRHKLQLDPADERFVDQEFVRRTIIGQRRELADLIRLQLYGVLWASTSVDRYLADTYNRKAEKLSPDDSYDGLNSGELRVEDLAFDVLRAGITIAGDIPLLLVNEPIYIAQGENSDIRYNANYPRWAFDEYRRWLWNKSEKAGWAYLDLWDALHPNEFIDSVIHYSPTGAEQLAVLFCEAILVQSRRGP